MSMFFTSRKTAFKSQLDTSSIPCCLSSFLSFFISQSRQLLDTQWIDRESSCLLDSFSTGGGQIELLFLQLMDCSSTVVSIPVSIDDHFLDTCLDSYLDTSRHLHLSRFIVGQYNLLVRSATHFLRSLSRQLSFFLSQTLSSHSNVNPQGFFKLFQDFPHLISFLSLSIRAFHVLKPRFWGF